MIKLLKFILFLIFLLLLGCSEEDSPVTTGKVPIIESINAADKWNPRLARKYKIEIKTKEIPLNRSSPLGVNHLHAFPMWRRSLDIKASPVSPRYGRQSTKEKNDLS